MSLETVDAIVVKTLDFSETSLIVTVFTRELGKVCGLAKGARRLKNPFETSLDLLTSIRLSFIRKNSAALDLFTEAKLRRRFRPTLRNLRGLYAGYYVAELLDFATAEYEPYPHLWSLADSTLERFATCGSAPARLAYFEAGLLNALGEFPSVRACVECGMELPLDRVENLDRRVFFDLFSGGVVCSRCRKLKFRPGLVPTTIGALKVFDVSLKGSEEELRIANALGGWRRHLEARASGISSIDKLDEERKTLRAFGVLDDATLSPYNAFPRSTRCAYRDLVEQYFCQIFRRRPRSLDFLPSAFIEPDRAEGEVAEKTT